ncbi:hypothetical protein MJO29_014714 [Puccinia striiformis f. sp. tritici]|nr:hypothetical protein MJO29_014714 [Puccinia striiformis f. sp. tritici]
MAIELRRVHLREGVRRIRMEKSMAEFELSSTALCEVEAKGHVVLCCSSAMMLLKTKDED